jgi:hypothetical protein
VTTCLVERYWRGVTSELLLEALERSRRMMEKMSDESASRCMSACRLDAVRQLNECGGIWVSRIIEAIAMTSDQAD